MIERAVELTIETGGIAAAKRKLAASGEWYRSQSPAGDLRRVFTSSRLGLNMVERC